MSMPRPSALEAANPGGRWSMLTVWFFDLTAGAASMWVTVHLRYQFEPIPAPDLMVLHSITVFALSCMVVVPLHGLHRGVWRFTALNDATRIIRAVVVANLVFLPFLFLLNRLDDFPRSSIFFNIPLLITILLGARMIVASWRTQGLRAALQFEDRSKPAAIMIGSETEIDDALRELARRNGANPFRIKGLIEPETHLTGRAIRGVPVLGGMDALPGALDKLNAVEELPPRIVLAAQKADARLVNRLIRIAAQNNAKISRARPGKGPDAFSPIEAADLLNRPPNAPDLEPSRNLIEGKRVLVTGAGGTIGSELARLAAALDPEKLILFDSSEASLYEIDMEFSERKNAPQWRAVLGDVRDEARLDTVFEQEKPHVVLHAAALKHVPLSETNPAETVRTNLLGTIRTIRAAQNHDAGVVVLISTDKAVAPSNIMGASKRAAELHLQQEARRNNSATRLCTVRFGNVLGSTGSVAPLFERQIEAGGPVTVTDPQATRYFMTVEEASGLVLAAAAQTAEDAELNGALYVLDMGEPVPILRLARQLIRLRGKDPDAEGAIAIIGLRAGEKRHEDLVYPYEVKRETNIEGVWSINGPVPDGGAVDDALATLIQAVGDNRIEDVRANLDAVCSIVPDS